MFGQIKNPQGELLDYTFHAGKEGRKAVVLIGHGVTGNKDRAWAVALGEALSREGIAALRFSYSGNGASGGRFVDSTISKEVGDLGAVIAAVQGWTVGYIGHSMGGAVGVMRASEDSRISLLVSLAGMVHTAAFAEREFGAVTPGQGFMWDEPSCPLSADYMKDLRGIGSLEGRATKIRVPWLLVHGTTDDVVPVGDSRDIFARADRSRTQLIEIPGANHVFSESFLQPMLGAVVPWVSKHLPG
ncbi:MAG TPA: alpha/beta hydrolase [Verrucomicrobiales bacterium]|nr:alpha/beta hydrolase [Verrucomicrobiales bacterium]